MGEDGERMSPEEVAEAIRSGTMVSSLLWKKWYFSVVYNTQSLSSMQCYDDIH